MLFVLGGQRSENGVDDRDIVLADEIFRFWIVTSRFEMIFHDLANRKAFWL